MSRDQEIRLERSIDTSDDIEFCLNELFLLLQQIETTSPTIDDFNLFRSKLRDISDKNLRIMTDMKMLLLTLLSQPHGIKDTGNEWS